jgi:hypothetical protein
MKAKRSPCGEYRGEARSLNGPAGMSTRSERSGTLRTMSAVPSLEVRRKARLLPSGAGAGWRPS